MSFNPKVSNSPGGSGRVQMIDYVPPSQAVNAGDVIIINGVACFALVDIAVGTLGALVFGGGVWAGNKASGGWTLGAPVYYNPTGSPNVGTASSGAFTQTYSAGYTFVGLCVLSPATGIAAATADQFGYFVKAGGPGAAGLRVVSGQMTTATASDTVVTGLNFVVSAVANLDAGPVTGAETVVASVGNQSGAPAAGSILVTSWKTLGGTPAAGTTFSLAANWIAYGY